MKHALILKMLAGATLALTVASSPAIARDHHGGSGDKDSQQTAYPNATRKEPSNLAVKDEKEQKAVNDGLAALQAGDNAKALQLLQPIADSSDSSKYAQSLALQGIANAKFKSGDTKGAIDALKRSLDIGMLPNDAYFDLELELAQFYLSAEQFQPAIDTVEKYLADGKRETSQAYAVEGNAYYRLQKYPEAIAALKKAQQLNAGKPDPFVDQTLLAAYSDSGQSGQAAELAQQQLANNPNDKAALSNAVAALAQSGKLTEAIALEEKSRAAGGFDKQDDYLNLAKLYYQKAQQDSDPKAAAQKAVAVLEEGLSKGVVKPGYDVYNIMANAAYQGEDNNKAVDAFRKAIPFAPNGDVAIAAGSLLLNEGKYPEAAKLFQQGIDKGVKKKGSAYMKLAEAKRGMKDKAGAIAAMKIAAQDPDTAAKAKAWLKQAGAGK